MPRSRHGRLVVPLVLAGGLLAGGPLTGCSSAAPAPATAPSQAPSSTLPEGSVQTDPKYGYRPAHELQFTGLAEGLITDAKVDCTRVDTNTYAWALSGDLGGTPLQVTFNTDRYRGAGDYPISGSPGAGVLNMTFGAKTATTDGQHTGTFTIDEDGETGSIDADLASADGQQHIKGPWSCTGD